MTTRSLIFRRKYALARRVQSLAAILLLGLYAAAVWHGAGDHHHALATPDACGTCPVTVCGAEPAGFDPAPSEDAHNDHTEPHACALCTLLHAPATPGIMLAAPAVPQPALAPIAAPTVVRSVPLVGNPPSRAPPFLSA